MSATTGQSPATGNAGLIGRDAPLGHAPSAPKT